MSRRQRWHPPLDPEDLELWEKVKESVTPLKRGRRVKIEAVKLHRPAPPGPRGSEAAAPLAAPPDKPRKKRALPPIVPIEKHVRRGLARAGAPIPERIDLHGLRQDEAHRLLLTFLRAAQVKGVRIVLIITGKGTPGDETQRERGVLRRSVPHWLSLPEFRALVVGFETAAPRDGGEGALYVHVRRRREVRP